MQLVFSKDDTKICKGIAILLMVFHHIVGIYYNKCDLNFYINAVEETGYPLFIILISTAGKVCVSLLTILSAYGIEKTFNLFEDYNEKHYIAFVAKRLFKFWLTYLPCFLLVFIIRNRNLDSVISFYETDTLNFKTLIGFILDMFCVSRFIGLNKTIGDWYIKAIIMFYILFPILHVLVKKFKSKPILMAAIIIVIYGYFRKIPIKNDSFVFYICEYITGIYLCRKEILDKAKANCNAKRKTISFFLLILFFFLRVIFSLPIDYFFSLSIIYFVICFATPNMKQEKSLIWRIIKIFGENSAQIWLLDPWIRSYLFKNPPYSKYIPYVFCILIISIILNCIWKKLNINKALLALYEKTIGVLLIKCKI